MNVSSEEFLKRLKSKDNEAFSFLIEKYHETLFKAAMKQGLGLDQAEEVVQETWSTFYQKVDNFEGRSHIRTYLFGILYNKIKELWRSNKKYTHDYSDEHIEKIFTDQGVHIQIPIDPSNWVESHEFLSILEEELEFLPENQRMVFYLKEVQELKSAEICKILDISNTNLGVLAYRAKHNIRARLEKRFNEK